MGGQDDLHVRVQFQHQVDESFLPLDVQRHLGLVHEEHVGLAVFHEHGEQDGKHLFLAAGELVGHQCLADLRESYLVLGTHNLLAGFGEQLVDDVLEPLLGLRQLLRGIGIALLQFGNDAVADVHLIVEVFALQVVQLEVECRGDAGVHMAHRLQVQHGGVQRADNVVADVRRVLGFHQQVDTFEQVVCHVAVRVDALHHLVQDGRLAHAVDAAQHVDVRVECPDDVLLAAPEGVNLNLLDVCCVLHSSICCLLHDSETKVQKKAQTQATGTKKNVNTADYLAIWAKCTTFAAMKNLATRRTIRQYSEREVSDQLLDRLMAEACRTQTMGNLQLYSVVVTRSADMKQRLAPAHFNQPMVTQAPVVLTVCADFNRTSTWARCRQAEPGYDNFLSFINAATDALLYTQTLCNLMDEEGLGYCYLGTTVYQPQLIIDILELPRLVMPVATLTVGWPDHQPALSDRLPLDSFVHRETYRDYLAADIDKYYYDKEHLPENLEFLRINHKDTLAQIFTDIRYTRKDNEAMSATLLQTLKKQGFLD